MKVFVGMSGGVDSSVTAALLKEQGYEVTGVYMKNWSQDLPGMVCPWKEDYQDAKRVAVQLGIPFKMYDFEKEYRQKVVNYMIEEYQAGRTPNPDIMCNQEVKFKLFLNTALADGADMIATGHYARIVRPGIDPLAGSFTSGDRSRAGRSPSSLQSRRTASGSATVESPDMNEPASVEPRVELRAGVDSDKDQSYFLCRVSEEALNKSLMPIGELTKPQVRELARKFRLSTAEKKDSQGICFVGKVGIKDFLDQFVQTTPGVIIDKQGNMVGEHDGALFYTIGQRHGLHVGGGLPYYVVGKNMDKNEVYVTTDLQDGALWNSELTLAGLHWINEAPSEEGSYTVRTRYRAPLIAASGLQQLENGGWKVVLQDEVRAITPGQSAVIYEQDRVVGSGIVC